MNKKSNLYILKVGTIHNVKKDIRFNSSFLLCELLYWPLTDVLCQA